MVAGPAGTAGGGASGVLLRLEGGGGPIGPVDANNDGVEDVIAGAVAGSFDDAIAGFPNTSGSIVTVPTGLSVLVTDAVDPDGVSVTVTGSGSDKVTLQICGFTVRLAAGSAATFTCGSIHISVDTGSVEVEVGGGAVMTMVSGSTANVSGVGSAAQFSGVTGSVSVRSSTGVVTPFVPGASRVLCNGLVPTVVGTTGNDRLRGTSGNDVVEAGDGSDVVDAGSGNDVVRGGAGDDRIDVGSGNDLLSGDAGNDIITGGSGNDTIDGGADVDRCNPDSGTQPAPVNCEA